MAPSSSRVKTDRAALKNIFRLELIPRQTRVTSQYNNGTAKRPSEVVAVRHSAPTAQEPGQSFNIQQMDPENVTITARFIPGGRAEENGVRRQKVMITTNVKSCEGNDRDGVIRDGSFTKGRYQQSKSTTRNKCKLGQVRKLCKLRMRVTWRLCAASDSSQTLLNQAASRGRGIMSCQIKLKMGRLTSIKASRRPCHTMSHAKSTRCKSRQVNTDTHVTHGAKGGRGSGGQSEVRARSAEWDAQPAAANTGRVPAGTRSTPTGLSNVEGRTQLTPTEFAGSEESPRRACSLSGDCKYVSPWQRTLGKQGHQSCNQVPEDPPFDFKIKEDNRDPETPQKTIAWLCQYPKVVLCDIDQNWDALSQNCSYTLPDVLKTKVVHCFKQEMRARFQFEPGCLGQNKHKNENEALSKNREFCPMVQSEHSICPSRRVTEHQRHLRECADAQTFSSHTTCCFPKRWTSDGTATCSASLSPGKCAHKGGCGTDMGDRGAREDPRPGFHLTGPEVLTDKRIKLGDSVKKGTLPSTPDSEKTACKNPEKNGSREREKTCSWVSDDSQSCAEHTAGSSSSLGTAETENSVCEKPCGDKERPTNSNAAQVPSDVFGQRNNGKIDEPESSTCQRVRAYLRKNVFSCARTDVPWPFSYRLQNCASHAVKPACPAVPIDPPDNSEFPINRDKPDTFRNGTNDVLSDAPKCPFSDPAQQVSQQNDGKRDQEEESIEMRRNERNHANMSMYSPNSTNIELAPHLMEAEKSQPGPASDITEQSIDTTSASSLPDNGPQSDSSASTPSPSVLGLSDWETATTLSSMSSPSTIPASSFLQRELKSVYLADASSPNCEVKAVEIPQLYSQMTRSAPFSPSHSPDSSQSCDSFLLLPQEKKNEYDEELTDTCPPKLEPYFNTSPIQHDLLNNELSTHVLLTNRCADGEFMLPPMLSPVTSPYVRSQAGPLPPSQGCLDEEEARIKTCKHINSPKCDMPENVNGKYEVSINNIKEIITESKGIPTSFRRLIPRREPLSFPNNNEDCFDSNAGQSQDESDCQSNREHHNEKFEEVPPDPKITVSPPAGFVVEPHSSSSSVEDDSGAVESSLSVSARGEMQQPIAEAACNPRLDILDEFSAFEQDILLVDVIQDDPELFENLPQESLLKLGPTRVNESSQKNRLTGVNTLSQRSHGVSLDLEQRLTTVSINYLCISPDNTEESNDRPWRPRCSSAHAKTQNNSFPSPQNVTELLVLPDDNNNVSEGLKRNQPITTVCTKNGPCTTIPANLAEFRRQKYNHYCRLYFSESLSCSFKNCRFQHVPVEGDEKYCIDMVTKFTKNPLCLQKAGAVFAGYYHNNPPGVYFSMPVLLSLLWTMLKAGMVSDIFLVLRVITAHRIVPSYEFLLALFSYVREKSVVNFIPELLQLTFKMASAGLVLSLDFLDCIKNTPDVQQTVGPNSVSGKIFSTAPPPDNLTLAHAIVEIEICTKQEDWRGMGDVFRSICRSNQRPNQMEHISGRIAIALLSESKDKLSLPFAAFAETACQNEEDSLAKGFLGRIGVSLMLRYHKTHQWPKGRRVVEVLIGSKINYSMLKGLFGNEDSASRCSLVTVATELLLLSGSVEGALNTLRENKWFLTSSLWPCEAADLESRIHVLMRLAEKTSHRDTLEVLCNLPGLKEPNELVDISRFCPLFNAHLRVCVDRQMLPVASDTVDFMLSQKLAVDHAMLQILLHKLGKQNLWLRAREVFRHSLSMGYYPGVSAPPGFMTLIVPCRLGEVELALALEMSITVNATVLLHLTEMSDSCLSITLRRTQSGESEYLSASSRLLSAGGILQPKLTIQYKAVNPSKEQVFTLGVSSARAWLRHNHLWANEVWAN